MEKALAILLSYIRTYKIDFFAFPVEKVNCMSIAIVSPEQVVNLLKVNANIFEKRENENFVRLRRKYKAVKVLPLLRPVAVIDTDLKSVKDIPPHADMKSRGFELVVNQYVNGVHCGDKLKQIDVISPLFGRIECKIGGGRFGEYEKGE